MKGKLDEYPRDILRVSMIVPTDRIRKDQLGLMPFEKIQLHLTEEDEWEDAFTILSVRLFERYNYTFNFETLVDTIKSLQQANILTDDVVDFWYRTDKSFPVIIEGRQNSLIFCPYRKGAEPPSLVIDRELNWAGDSSD